MSSDGFKLNILNGFCLLLLICTSIIFSLIKRFITYEKKHGVYLKPHSHWRQLEPMLLSHIAKCHPVKH